jgi:hypothetical protein
MVVHTCNPNYLGGRDRMITVLGQAPGKSERLSEKQTKSKRTGGVAQMVACLPSMRPKLQSPVPQKAGEGMGI